MSSRLGHGSFGVLDRSLLSECSRDPLAVTGNVNRRPARALHSYALFVCHAASSKDRVFRR